MLLFNVLFWNATKGWVRQILLAFISLGLNKDAKLVNLFCI